MVLLAVSLLAALCGAVPVKAASTTVVRLPFPHDDGSLTPYTFQVGYPLVTLIYDTLMWRDADGVPQPWLAAAVEPSTDGRRVVIRLRLGVLWHDGTPLTADDVAFTFRFVADHPHPRFTPQLRAVSRVDVTDPKTVVVTLRHRSPGFSDQPLSDLPILPAHLWRNLSRDRLAPDGLPVGSGPFRLVEHQPGKSYRFEANRGYFRGPPALDALEVPIMNTAEETIRALERRAVDMIPVSLPEDVAERVRGLGIRVVDGNLYLGTVLMFNLRRPPFDRVEVRQAVAKALDLRRVVRAVGDAAPADRGYLHPESVWASPEPLHRTDEAAAKAELTALGIGPVEVLVPDNDPVKSEAGRQVVLALQRAGVSAETRVIPRPELARAVGEDGTAPTFSMAIWTSPPLASYDPDFLYAVFGSDAEDATINLSGYRSTEFDELAERMASAPDAPARTTAVGETLRLLATDLPVVPLFFASGTFTYRPAIYDGWTFVKGSGILDKRSFTEPLATRREGSVGQPPATAPATTDPHRPVLLQAALGLLLLAAILAATATIRRHRG